MKKSKNQRYKIDDEDISFVAPSLTEEEQREACQAFSDYRRKHEKSLTEDDKLKYKLLQLRFQMEDYAVAGKYDEHVNFGYFLRQYTKRLNRPNSEFAGEIGVHPSELSQILNRHRDPSNRIIMRLEFHSNKILPALLWFNCFSREKAFELTRDEHLREEERRVVKNPLRFFF